MPRVALATQTVTDAGVAPTYVAANTDGHSVPNGRQVILHVRYSDAAAGAPASMNVTLVTPGNVGGLDIADRAISIPNSTTDSRFIALAGPYEQGDRSVHVNYSSITGVTVAALQHG